MDVVLIFNGLGNQMSQYAFYLAKRKKNKNVRCIFDPNSVDEHNGSELERLFNISYKRTFIDRLLSMVYSYRKRPKIWSFIKLFFIREIKECQNYDYDESLLGRGALGINYYWGGWHSERYYSEIVDELKEIFKFKLPCSSENLPYIEKIKCTNSVSIHIRRGDYLKYKEYGGVATLDYYRKAIDYISCKIQSPVFFVFSNDMKWCRNNFKGGEYYFIDCNSDLDAWQDMYLMSMCKHHINANSTFSWWGAWLSSNDGITIVPHHFILNIVTNDIYPQKWVKL